MTLNQAFAHALKNDTISHLEMSWSMKITEERLQELLNGAEYNQAEELAMYRFIFKANSKQPILKYWPNSTLVVPSSEKSNGI